MNQIISGFSKLSKDDKIKLVTSKLSDPSSAENLLKSYWHRYPEVQKLLDEFSENTLTNYFIPYGVAPNFLINGKFYFVPMVIEESSVIAAAANAAKYWASRGGFHAQIISSVKIGQVHFIWKGDYNKLNSVFNELKFRLKDETQHITANMIKRGGGILDIQLVDMRHEIEDYFQLKATFETVDSMGANFINSCLEDFAQILKDFIANHPAFDENERDCRIIMSILSNYTPECLVKCWVECDLPEMGMFEDGDTPESFTWKFERAIRIAQVDVNRAVTHNKGIFNGIDAVVIATGNDFRAVEACGHAYASRDGKYRSLTTFSRTNNRFYYCLTVPMALGTVGGLTSLHPLSKFSLELLGNPSAKELIMIAAAAGLANNFGAVTTLVTKGIQKGHMKMHLLNILNHFEATEEEKNKAIEYFKTRKVSFNAVRQLLNEIRDNRA